MQIVGRALVLFTAVSLGGCAPENANRAADEAGGSTTDDRRVVEMAGGDEGSREREAVSQEERLEAAFRRMKARLPEGFHAVIEPPFVVAGDDKPEDVEGYAAGTVRWATRLLKDGFYEKDPSPIVEVWLFKDKVSYMKHARELFDDRPTTPFGYYSPHHEALIMNIATGGGTLVHEIVHPFMATNFPACPDWLNEGMGSLYEQCNERGGKIVGSTNWRLDGLQEAIAEDRTVSLEWLLKTSRAQFYGAGSGLHYAQARYLCYWLQEQGLLRKFYHRLHSGVDDDPTGLTSFRKVSGRDDLEVFQREWEMFVMKLRR